MSEDSLPIEVHKAWEAYQAMRESKSIYFGFLKDIDQQYREGGSPTFAENLQLEKLLRQHDDKVAAFNEAMAAVTDADDRKLLLDKLSSDTA
jgi:hypothetical protein